MGEISENHNLGGVAIYYENNTVELIRGIGDALKNQWRNSRKAGIVCLKVYELGQFDIQKTEDYDNPQVRVNGRTRRPRKNFTCNYAKTLQGHDFYWYDNATDKFETGDVVPGGVNATLIGTGKLVTKEYFLFVYNRSIRYNPRPAQDVIREISDKLNSQVSFSIGANIV
jgi:hypothetical protein